MSLQRHDLKQAERYKLMNSLTPSQAFLCNEIGTVTLSNDWSHKVSRGLRIPQALFKDELTRAKTDLDLDFLFFFLERL